MNLMESIIKGYTDRVLGPDQNAAAQSTASAYQQLQDALNQKYQTEQQEFEANPANQGQAFKMPDSMTRWGDQINAMITSGNPVLQQQGLGMLQDYMTKSAAGPSANSMPAAVKEYQYAVKNDGFTGTFQDWKEAMKSGGTNINLNTGSQRGIYLTKDEKLEGGLDPNAPYVWTKDGPKPVGASKESEMQKPVNVAETTVNDIDEMLFGESGIMHDYKPGTEGRLSEVVKANAQKYLQNDPRYAMYDQLTQGSLSNVARALGGEKGALSDSDVARVQTLLPVVTGINPDTPEVAKQKIRRLKNLVKLARQKGGLTSDEIKRYTTGYAGQEKRAGVPESLKRPAKTLTSPSGIQFTVE